MLLVKETTYSFSEFIQYLDSKNIRKLDKEVGVMLKVPKTRKLIITLTACLMHYTPVLADVGKASAKIAQLGSEILGLCQTAGYWVCLVMCVLEIIKAGVNGDSRSISKIMAKYILLFSGLYFMPWIFDSIRDVFN